MAYLFEWDPGKAAANFGKHRVRFEEASTVFGGPFALLIPDPDHSFEESWFLLLGSSNQGRLLVVAFAERPPLTRIISARLANSRERKGYEEES